MSTAEAIRRVTGGARGNPARPATNAPPPFTSLVPADGPRAVELGRRAFAAVTLAYAAYYLYWRWTATLNPDALWFAVPLAVAETFAIASTAFFVFNVWRLRRREPRAAPAGLSVDVFVTTYDEPVELVRKTALAAQRIRYPHRTYLLDDGARDEVRALAAELGIDYVRRSSNEGAKAGNLNHALRHTSGEFILQLDADHVPLPHILDRLLGYFADARMAFVQSPQCFYNHDGFTGHHDARARRYFAEQDIFFNVIQPGKDRHNAAFFCGSCAVIRRAALDELGGFSATSVTEDFETSLRLHAAGWCSAYHAEPLAFGLAARTASAFHTQRLRWGQGTMQVWRRFNPLTLPGLSVPQRICYFYSVLVYLDGLPRLVFYLAPVAYLIGGVLPVQSAGLGFLARFIPLFAAAVLLNRMMARGHGAPLWLLERNNLAKVWTHALALTGYVVRRPLRFRVTAKGVGGVSARHLAPHAALVVLAFAAIVWGTVAFVTGAMSYGAPGEAALPFLVNIGWAGWNSAIAVLVLRTAVTSRERRAEYRFPDALPMAFRLECAGSRVRLGALVDISAAGAAIRTTTSAPAGARVHLTVALPGGAVFLVGRVVRVSAAYSARRREYVVGIDLTDAPREARDRIALYCLQHVAPLRQDELQRPQPFLGSALRRNRRDEQRVAIGAAALLRTAPDRPVRGLAIARNVSGGGVCFDAPAPIPRGTLISYTLPDLARAGTGEVVHVRDVTTALGIRHIVGVAHRDGQARIGTPARREDRMVDRLTASARKPLGRAIATVTLLLILLAAIARPLGAQLASGYIAGAEAADNGQRAYLLGGWWTRAGTGWAPIGTLFAYRVELADAGAESLWGVNPAVGLRYQAAGGAAQATAGYAWQTSGGAPLVGGGRRIGSGVTTALQADYWGGGQTMAQAIASYSWGGEGYLWSRGRLTLRIVETAAGALRAGADAGWQGNSEYAATDIGGVVEWHRLPLVLSLTAGYRSVGTGVVDSGPYVGLTAVFMPVF